MTVLQTIPPISITDGKPTTLFPLSFVISVSMIKDALEDWKRHKSDKKENQTKVLVADKHTDDFKMSRWMDIKVGQILRVNRDEYFPADMVLIQSSQPKGICYVETKNLDGETNLKHKIAPSKCAQLIDSEEMAIGLTGKVHCQAPDDVIYKFEGTLSLDALGDPISVDHDQLCLRGSSL